jgi:N-acetylneuraminic acid mutarotase
MLWSRKIIWSLCTVLMAVKKDNCRKESVKMKRLKCAKISNFVWILIILMLWGILNIAPMTMAAVDTWTTRADMPTPRWGLSTSVVDGKIYAIGGGQGMIGKYMSPVEEYDPATDTWTKKADMPTGRAFFSTSVVNGKIYAIGGAPGDNRDTTAVEEYDPATDTWTRKADMPTERCFHSTCVVNGKIYAFGGRFEPEDLNLATVEEYDPATDTWTQKADMPKARFAFSTSAIDGKIYVIGGVEAPGGLTGPAISTVEEYDPATESWMAKADMPTARAFLSTCVVNRRIFAIGGTPGSWGGIRSTVEEYNPATDTWTKRPDMPTARCMPSASTVKGKIYTIGGSVKYAPWTPTSTVEVYEIGFIPADFNRDGIVNIEDLLILIENWGQNEPLVDIAPLPFGDGIVDSLDLELLMSYWGLKVDDIIAHWALDETEGVVAHDSIGLNNGTLHGEPVWQPAGGKFAGALEFDGIDDYVETDFVLNPAAGSFSVFAWVKGGSRGQVIISQTDDTGQGTRWLWADPSYGRLMTRLMHPPFDPLVSESVITDGQWHHVGLVYDVIGLCRCLYVDGAQVAKDTDFVGGMSVLGGLYFGAGKTLDAGSFFTGMIDDIRIYGRALSAEEVAELAREG